MPVSSPQRVSCPFPQPGGKTPFVEVELACRELQFDFKNMLG